MRMLPVLADLLLAVSSCFAQTFVWRSPSPNPGEAATLLRAVCPGAVQPGGSAPASLPGCKPCPQYTQVGGTSQRMAMRESFGLHTVIYGSFTLPGVREAVASFEGCEPHARGYGGSVLLRKLRGSWARVDYNPGLITSSCQTYQLKTGRDLLLCEEEDHHMAGASQWILVCDFSKEEASRYQTVFDVIDTRGACGHSAVWASIDKVVLRDLNGDGMPDLTLWFSVGQGTFSNVGGSCNSDTVHVPVQKQQLDFLFQQDTDTFYSAPWSKALAESYRVLFSSAQQKAFEAVTPSPAR